jgi:hypothetical protein
LKLFSGVLSQAKKLFKIMQTKVITSPTVPKQETFWIFYPRSAALLKSFGSGP